MNLNTVDGVEHYIYSGNLSGKKSKKAFEEMKLLSDEGDADAACLLGILYKDGIGTRLDFNKAREQFKQAYELGSEKAAYSLGYLYLKGLGNIGQDYRKALKWLEKSKYPMAKHWLAQFHYYGYGLPINKQKGLELLRANAIGNSEVLLSQWEYEMKHPEVEAITQNSNESGVAANTNDTTQINSGGLPHGVLGNWLGEWQIMDWSGQKVTRTIPIEIEISDTGNRLLYVKIVLDGNEFNGGLIQTKNELIFPDMSITLKKRYTDHPDELTLNYRLTSFVFRTSSIAGVQYLAGELETTIENWSEPGPPGRLILQKEAKVLNPDVLEALAEQNGHFFKVHPNPFEEDLLLHYVLGQDSEVSIRLLDYYQPSKVVRVKQRKQKKGEHMLALDGLNTLKSGLYIIDMTAGAGRYSRIVIRK